MQHFSEIEKEIETSMLMFLEMPVHWVQPTIVRFIATTTNEVNWGQHNSKCAHWIPKICSQLSILKD